MNVVMKRRIRPTAWLADTQAPEITTCPADTSHGMWR